MTTLSFFSPSITDKVEQNSIILVRTVSTPVSTEQLMYIYGLSPAITLAVDVFPVPGDPWNKKFIYKPLLSLVAILSGRINSSKVEGRYLSVHRAFFGFMLKLSFLIICRKLLYRSQMTLLECNVIFYLLKIENRSAIILGFYYCSSSF